MTVVAVVSRRVSSKGKLQDSQAATLLSFQSIPIPFAASLIRTAFSPNSKKELFGDSPNPAKEFEDFIDNWRSGDLFISLPELTNDLGLLCI